MAGADASEKLKVFVSYSRDDVAYADQIVAMLEDAGFEPLIDRHQIVPGEPWEPRLSALIFGCDKVVFLLTEHSAASPVCQWEVEEADRLGKPMVPVTLRELPPDVAPPPKLTGLNYIFLYPKPDVPGTGWHTGARDLTAWLRSDLAWTRGRTRLMERARQHASHAADALLMRGEELTEALAWAARTPTGESVPPDVSHYIQASEALETRLKAEAEADLAAREAALQQAEKAVGEQRKAQRGQRRAILIGLVATLLLAAFGGWANWIATTQGLEAQTLKSQLYAGESARLSGEGDHVTGTLLAILGNPSATSDGLEQFLRNENPAARTSLIHAFTHNQQVGMVQSTSQIHDIAAHPTDPDVFVTAHQDGFARLWRRGTPEPIQEFNAGIGLISAVAFHPDGEQIFTGGTDSAVTLWRIGEANPQRIFSGDPGWIADIAVTPDGNAIFVGSHNGQGVLWPIDGDVPSQIVEQNGRVLAVAISDDGSLLLTGGGDDTAKLWQVGNTEPVAVFEGHGNSVSAVAFHPDGQHIVTGSHDQTVRVWDIQGDDTPITLNAHDAIVLSVAVHPDGEWIASSGRDNISKLWRLAAARRPISIQSHGNWVTSTVFTSDGEHLLTGSHDDTARFWQVESEPPERLFQGHEGPIKTIDVDPNGDLLLSGSSDQTARLWDIDTGTVREVLRHDDEVVAVSFHPDGGSFLTSDHTRHRIWTVGVPNEVGFAQPDGRTGFITSDSVFHPDGERFLDALFADGISIWDLDGSSTQVIDGQEYESTTSMAVSPNGEFLGATSFGQTFEVWTLEGTDQVLSVEVIGGSVDSIEFSPTSDAVLIGLDAGTAQIWGLDDEAPRQTFIGHRMGVRSTVFSSDGEFVLTGSADRTAKLWRVGEDAPLQTFMGHDGFVWDVAFHPDGQHVFTGTQYGVVGLWALHPFLSLTADEQIEAACARLAEITPRPWLTQDDAQNIPILRGLSEEELDPCRLRPSNTPVQPQ